MRSVIENDILPRVEKPSRYLGTELNTVHKDPAEVDLRIALVFPDLYDLGLGNLGLLILYSILNDLDWCWCERAYSPAPDMEALLRERDMPLFCNESKDSVGDMDLIGVTLQSELTYTNILTIIDMAGLPLRAVDRDEDAPLIFGGGPAVFNPEPLAPFFDFFVIGEGEDVILEIAELMRDMKGRPKLEKLKALVEIEGIYVPELYPMDVLPNGQILPKEDAPKIVKRLVDTLDGAKFPTNYIVPFTQQVHDRLSLEVLRGCTQGCRFCQAGMVTRPVRERTLENIDQLMKESLEKTGYEEVSLVSLSTCDYSRPVQLAEQAAVRGRLNHTSISLPSLRLDSFSVEMADRVSDVRRSGLTFAPEAATPRLRSVINKWIPDEDLLNMSAEAFKRGWKHVKCYFMIGLPTERDEDVEAIGDLCKRNLAVGRAINPNAKIHLGVSTFVPKPFTPFQWAEQIDMEETERRQDLLGKVLNRNKNIKFGRHTSETTFIEGLITRADRRGADLIEAAWRNGARFESWDELCNLDAWLKAIDEIDYDVKFEFRQRDLDERLPWDHIDVLMPKEWFQEDWNRAMELQHAQDCRAGKCHMCGVISRERKLCQHMLVNQRKGRIDEKEWSPEPQVEYVEPEPVQRVRFRIGWDGEVRHLSHLERQNVWIRALRRAKTPMAYSQGFHAHPKIQFASASPVGEASGGDYLDVVLTETVNAQLLGQQLHDVLPKGFSVLESCDVPLRDASLSSLVMGMEYTLYITEGNEISIQARVDEIMASEEWIVSRRAKVRGKKRRGPAFKFVPFNFRPCIADLAVIESPDSAIPGTAIRFTTRLVEGKLAKPKEVFEALEATPNLSRVVRENTLLHAPDNQFGSESTAIPTEEPATTAG